MTLEIQNIEKEVNVRYVTSVERHGIKKGKEQVAREMLLENYPIDKIKKLCQLTDEQINKIKESATTH